MTKKQQENEFRDLKMIAQYRAGMTLMKVGVLNGVTRERVRQVLVRHGIPSRHRGILSESYVTFMPCTECGEIVEYRQFKSKGSPVKKFCNRICWVKNKTRYSLSKEEKTKILSKKAMERYHTRPESKASRMASKKKYESSEKYKFWYEKHKANLREATRLLREKRAKQ